MDGEGDVGRVSEGEGRAAFSDIGGRGEVEDLSGDVGM
jgi:hypothetical protein